MTELEQPPIFNASDSQLRHVAFLDILGFSAKVLSDFHGTVKLYADLVKRWQTLTRSIAYPQVKLTIYSDSIILICEELPPLLQATTSLYMITMSLSCMLRGGVASGRHISSSSDQDTYVVSEPLTRAAALEKVVRNPCVAIHEAVKIPDQWWPINFPNVNRPILWFEGQQIVNPFHRYWYKSGKIVAEELSSLYPDHRSKYDWFIRLYDAVGSEDPLIPPRLLVMQNG